MKAGTTRHLNAIDTQPRAEHDCLVRPGPGLLFPEITVTTPETRRSEKFRQAPLADAVGHRQVTAVADGGPE